MIENLVHGLSIALTWHNLLYASFGVFLGNLIGVLPGIGALAGISMLLPVTYGLDPVGAILMLSGLYYGTSFGGATTSILLNIPGTPTHAVVCLDGYPLAQQNRGGAAIFMAMFASFIGVCIAILIMTFFGPVLADIAFKFGPTEYFMLMLFGLIAASTLSSGYPIRAIGSVVIGLLIGVIGTDVNTGTWRFTFGIIDLTDGISLVALALALFGISDVFQTAGILGKRKLGVKAVASKSVRPTMADLRGSVGPILRGTAIGSFFGALPGTGGTMASFMSYAAEKNVARDPRRFGRGAMEGVSGPEAANSSADITAFIPTLTLGIPGDAVMALMLGALMIHNITPGPRILIEHRDLFWGLIMSFWVGNVMLLILNIPLIGLWVKLLSVPYRFIYPSVLFFISVASYTANNSLFDVGVTMLLGVLAFFGAKLKIPPAPLLLAFVLGPMMEENFRRAVLLARGDLSIFITRPLSASFFGAIVLVVVWVIYAQIRMRRATRTEDRSGS